MQNSFARYLENGESYMIKTMDKKQVKKVALFIFYAIIIWLTIYRIVIQANYPYYFLVDAGADDQLMVYEASNILQGNWLSSFYYQMTLTKSVTFPMLLAFFRCMGIPYGLGLGLLFVAISYIFARAVKPLVRNPYFSGIIYLIILYSPVGLAFQTTARLYRNSISHWLALFVISGIIGVYVRRDSSFVKLLGWTVITLIALTMFWQLREDHIWIAGFVIPADVILFIYWIKRVVEARKGKKASGDEVAELKDADCDFYGRKNNAFYKKFGTGLSIASLCLFLILPIATVAVSEYAIAKTNYNRYGIFTLNDRSGTNCGRVMTDMYQIDDGQDNDIAVWISRAAIEKAYAASPTLASIREQMDYRLSCGVTTETDRGIETPGDHVEWALRAAAADVGYYTDAVSTNAFFGQIADELEAGFENGQLSKKEGIYLSSQMKCFQKEDIDMTLSLLPGVLKNYCSFTNMSIGAIPYYVGQPANAKGFEEVLGIPMWTESESSVAIAIGVPIADVVNNLILWFVKLRWIRVIRSGIGFAFMIVNTIRGFIKKEYHSWYAFMLTAGVLVVSIVYTAMITIWGLWMKPTPDHSLFLFYGSCGPMLLQVFRILFLIYLGREIVEFVKNRKNRTADKESDTESDTESAAEDSKNVKVIEETNAEVVSAE